jgi:2-oxoglutarate dehydrogenase E1 component
VAKDFKQSGFLFGSNSVFIEELYQKYLQDPDSVDASWVEFFGSQNDFAPLKTTATVIARNEVTRQSVAENLSLRALRSNLISQEGRESPEITTSCLRTPRDEAPSQEVARNDAVGGVAPSSSSSEYSLRAKFMIKAYRERGHYLANLDPLGLEVLKTRQELKLTLADFGFSTADLSKTVDVTGEFDDLGIVTLEQLISVIDQTYSGSVAVEFSHIENSEQQLWLYDKIENVNTHTNFSDDEKKALLKNLVGVEGFEQYLHVKFPGAKRFSIEGGDASIVSLEMMIDESAAAGAQEAVIGMAHRGRLSTLTKVMGKPYVAIFSEFMGNSAFPSDLGVAGDVKYHMGFSSDKKTKSGNTIHLSLTPNPSHLEAVNPVVAGKVRAKQDCMNRDRSKVVGVLVHGDAAFCGQGVVAESLVMSGLEAYDVGGILHLVINNQIGFTANSYDARSGRYCTEVAKMVGAPIFHVNGDDIEAVVAVTKIACEYRQKFGRDVVIDIVCYRKYGHNEGDEPMYTQSVMYNIIKNKKTPAAIYADKLIASGLIDANYYPNLKQEFKESLEVEFNQVKTYKPRAQWLEGHWSGFDRMSDDKLVTGVAKSELVKIGTQLCTMPSSFAANPKLVKLFDARAAILKNDEPIDWATGEQLSFATMLLEKTPIRMTGQDVERGTFSHRHAVLHSQVDGTVYQPLNNISTDQAPLEIADSNLSEYGVLGFEYGYSIVDPNRLVIWEAQFGDFANGAQIIFDQFISSAETKWLRMSGIVVLLPNGMEGQGPEHSSARLERFLQLCAEDNMYVTYPTTPASIFHLLRRQVKRNFRKPLIVMSPKSLLRHKLAVSKLSEIDSGTSFTPIIDEIDAEVKAAKVSKVVFCSGKVYYDLLEMRRAEKIDDIAIIRFEQLYPFEEADVIAIVKKYSKAESFVWCQEEPRNMGAWKFIRPRLDDAIEKAGLKKHVHYVGRERSASPAVGYLYVHDKQQEALAREVLGV